jgi:uncharacterized protein
MKSREFDPVRLDVERFASEGGRLNGVWPLREMPRLVDACHVDAAPADEDPVSWAVGGERRRQGAAEVQTWLQLEARARLNLVCQRCLGPVETPLMVDRRFRFVAGETQAAQLDAESEDDVLASTRSLDLRQLVEDELLLALPLVPRHDACPVPLHPAVGGTDAAADAELPESPFAALAGLRRASH